MEDSTRAGSSGGRTSTQSPPLKSFTPIEADSPATRGSDDDHITSQDPEDSVFQFEEANGRTYHGYRRGAYLFPNDAPETDRLDLQHTVMKTLLSGKNHLAPIPTTSAIKILDIGTGTGIWAVEMGDQYPLAEIQGTDLSPIQPTHTPPNVEFFIDDASESDWVVPPESYDYIHTRVLLGCFTDFSEILKRAFHYTRPGGYVESQEILLTPSCDDGSMPQNWPMSEWWKYLDQAAFDADKPLRIAHRYKRWYEEAGFTDVKERIFKMPLNNWPREKRLKGLGEAWQENMQQGLGGFSAKLFIQSLNWSREETEVYLVNVRKALADRNVHAYQKVYVVWGRKPFPGEVVTRPGSS